MFAPAPVERCPSWVIEAIGAVVIPAPADRERTDVIVVVLLELGYVAEARPAALIHFGLLLP